SQRRALRLQPSGDGAGVCSPGFGGAERQATSANGIQVPRQSDQRRAKTAGEGEAQSTARRGQDDGACRGIRNLFAEALFSYPPSSEINRGVSKAPMKHPVQRVCEFHHEAW